MSDAPIVVLKFGGSVLTDTDRFADVAREIGGWRADGWLVVAVVSALCGRTDELVSRCRSSKIRPDAHTQAGVLALGERESSALLALALGSSGLPALALTPGGVGLRAEGDPLDATPTALDSRVFHDALARSGVIVFPGFVALDMHGRTVTLGRGGSDLTALFLAHALGAQHCRLVKDVDGLYDRDPATHPDARRFDTATYEHALATDGSIVQHKAVRFARRQRITFTLGRLGDRQPTVIGMCSGEGSLAPRDPESPRPRKDAGCAGSIGACDLPPSTLTAH
ncbi:MAG: hypothetical protein Tsb0013_16760 [Phycisphaerales bacterium]